VVSISAPSPRSLAPSIVASLSNEQFVARLEYILNNKKIPSFLEFLSTSELNSAAHRQSSGWTVMSDAEEEEDGLLIVLHLQDLVDVDRTRKLPLELFVSATVSARVPTELERETVAAGGGKVTRNSASAFMDAPDGSCACSADARSAAYLWSAVISASAPGMGGSRGLASSGRGLSLGSTAGSVCVRVRA
jgi:hypothetical protein